MAMNIPIEKILPTIMVILALGSSIGYAIKGISEWRMALYWLAAATLNYVVTW